MSTWMERMDRIFQAVSVKSGQAQTSEPRKGIVSREAAKPRREKTEDGRRAPGGILNFKGLREFKRRSECDDRAG